ncbi:pyrroline-5-carboxylate reductase [Agrococcus jejuensis]|uniref:Pyrroline-5-carboxylate reductase n=1 Tax=Agrococcus jejuensis TaxID=399736 RepID=A0A1G8EU04_9MICO|nr:pyrroline-5-carboxylate reductase [Agrococcus jejuensis]SDH73368.1 pyrroline-5-carboxylate reductase [Agrococcus jejuensis]
MTTSLPSIAILGAGSMGGAILAGLVADRSATSLTATNRSRAKAEAAAADGVRSIALEDEPGGNASAAAEADVVVVGVKPYMIADLLTEIGPSLRPGTIVVSLAVGTTCAAMEALLPESVAVARAMPNTPSHVGRGVTGVAGGSRATAEQVALAASVFEVVGEVLVVEEAQIDALSTISGSGPAYVFLLIEQLTGAAERMGFTPEQAATMVQETFAGASALLADAKEREPGIEPAELRRRVTSPRGTTERAVEVLQDAGLGAIFDRATAAAAARAAEIAAE